MKDLSKHPYKYKFWAVATIEYKNLKYCQAFYTVLKTSAIQILPLVWVFIYKFNTNGYLSKYKAHLCIQDDF